MSWFRVLPVRLTRRLYSLSGVALLAVAALAGASIHFARGTSHAAQRLYGYSLAGVVNAADLELLLEKHRRIIETAPVEFDRDRNMRDTLASEAIVDQLEALTTTREEDARGIAGDLPELVAKGRRVLFFAANFAQDRAIEAVADYVKVADRVHVSISSYRGRRLDVADTQVASLARSASQLTSWVLAVAAIALLLIGPFSFLIIRDIVGRLRQITDVMLRLSRNETTVAVTSLRDADEVGDMARAVQVFKSNAIALIQHKEQLEHVNQRLDVAVNNMMRGLAMFDRDRRLTVCNLHYASLYELPEALCLPGTPLASILEFGTDLEAKQEARTIEAARLDAAGPRAAKPDGEGAAFRSRSTDALAMHVASPPTVSTKRAASPPRSSASTAQPPWRAEYARLIDARAKAVLTHSRPDARIIDISYQPLDHGGWVEVHEDVTEKNRAEAREAQLARQCAVTGLANRLRFREALANAFQGQQRDGLDFAVLCLDLDHFKIVNDTLGHPIGDALLKAVGDRLAHNTRPGDLVARLGGDEFAVIQDGASHTGQAGVLADRLVACLSRPYEINGHAIVIGASIGIALAPGDGGDADHLLRNADMALYRAKALGRGTSCFFKPEMEGEVLERRALEVDLRRALETNQLELYYQPLVSLADHRASGFEALLRWHHPERGMVSPARFIPLAEERGLIGPIGAWALMTACREAAGWAEPLRVSVNLSVLQFKSGHLERDVRAALDASGLDPRRLELEVTESLLLTEDPATVDQLRGLKALGLTIALDDFGTGYSSLSYLRAFPFDKIKIDQSFVRDISNRRDCVAIVRAVASLARTLSMRTVAEGVETLDHLERVRSAGCDEAQGYFFSRPVPASEVAGVVARCAIRGQAA